MSVSHSPGWSPGEGGREGERERGREGGKEGGRERGRMNHCFVCPHCAQLLAIYRSHGIYTDLADELSVLLSHVVQCRLHLLQSSL